MSASYQQDLQGCFEHYASAELGNSSAGCALLGHELRRQQITGTKQAPITPAFEPYSHWLGQASPILHQLQASYLDGSLALLSICDDDADIKAAERAYGALAKDADVIVFFGTGGSSLGGQTLAQLIGWNVPGASVSEAKRRPHVWFYDNLDPVTLTNGLKSLDLKRTRFVATSKSGGTAETLAQTMLALQAVKAAGLQDQIPNMFLGLTEPAQKGVPNGLRDLFDHFDIPMLDHSTKIGGRYSVLSNVGVLPALAVGVDVRALRAGAKAVIDDLMQARTPSEFAPAQGAAMTIALAQDSGIHVQFMMPFADRLQRFANWYKQLWGESIGKDGQGTTPVSALGPVDQHSILQLLMDGPCEHFITIIAPKPAQEGPIIDEGLAKIAGATYLGGCSIATFVAAQVESVIKALRSKQRPVRIMRLAKLDEHSLGGLMMHFMLETIISGHLLGVNPYDQPAVELAKHLARERLEGDQA